MYRHLLFPGRLGSLELRDRLATAPLGVEIAGADGQVREPVVRRHIEGAIHGGCGAALAG
jgi:2,4-dienoyl-CoA reductase-like NADH-dependent reductase (Old Yellow Enzyme family)